MNPILAVSICTCGIAGLFYLERDQAVRTSKALWLAIIYCWIIGSRSVSEWLNMSPGTGRNVQLEGSPLDAAFYGILLAAAIVVLVRRRRKSRMLLVAIWPILIYFFYCLISVAWSDHPDISFKRWIKAIIDVAMAMIVVTDNQPLAALRRLFSRVGFILLPTSVLLIKYFPALGRSFTVDGLASDTGVSTDKNIFGVMLLVISLGTLWRVIDLVRTKKTPARRRRLIAQGVLLAFGILLLRVANSATSLASFMLGGTFMLLTSLRVFRGRSSRVQWLCLTIVLLCATTYLVTGSNDVANALGRKSNLSGRTAIWAALLPTVPNALVGAGFESYWISPNVQEAWDTLARAHWWHPEILVTEAHNGYIEVYLNLGWAGLALISLILLTGYRRAVAALQMNASVGSLTLAYIIVAVTYSITEAGFRPLTPMWIFLVLAIVVASGITLGMFNERSAYVRTLEAETRSSSTAHPSWVLDIPVLSSESVEVENAPSTAVRWSLVAARSTSRVRKS